MLFRSRIFFEKRKQDENRNRNFYIDLSKKIKKIFEATKIFNTQQDDVLSHWILKMAFAREDEEDHFFSFYEKILFSGTLFKMATEKATQEYKSKNRTVVDANNEQTRVKTNPGNQHPHKDKHGKEDKDERERNENQHRQKNKQTKGEKEDKEKNDSNPPKRWCKGFFRGSAFGVPIRKDGAENKGA